MTREEAITVLNMVEAYGLADEAKQMAIKALEQQPCEDCVSRKAVIDDLSELLSDWDDNYNVPLVKAIGRVEDSPSVTQKSGKWIPVSERLPEDAYGCLVTVYDTDLRTQDEFENILPYFVGYDGNTWNDADGEPIPFEVIAWMPLPKPYEPQESEDKE